MYAALLGGNWQNLPPSIRTFHQAGAVRRASGLFRVRGGANIFARAIARIGGMPRPADAVAVTLVVAPNPDGEEWRRKFGAWPLVSRQATDGQSIVERFGRVEVRFRLDVLGGQLRYVFERAALCLPGFAVPLPLTCSASERAGDAGIDVSVEVSMKAIGRLIAYDGTLTTLEVDA